MNNKELERVAREIQQRLQEDYSIVIPEVDVEYIAEALQSYANSRIQEFVREVEGMNFEMQIEEYLPKVKAWKGGYDAPFDDGYSQAKKDILALSSKYITK